MTACSREPEAKRVAVLTFENLTGDASLDWIESAAPSVIAAEIGAARAGSASDAYLENAGRIVHGYFVKDSSNVRFEIAVESAARHKLTDTQRFSGTLLGAMTAAAKTIDPAARSFSTSREDAVEAWGQRDFEKAIAIDPDFGTAWLGWVELLLQRGDAAQATSIADRALARNGLRSDLDRARIDLIAANLHNDPPRRSAALAAIAKLSNDPAVMRALAESETNARHFDAAIAAYQNFLAENPDDTGALLSLGYAQALAGRLDAAKETFEKYGKQRGQETNSLDSLGEAYFMNGRFAEAEKYFLAAHQSNPAFLNGGEQMKAAYAHWLAGDLKGADAMAEKYFRDPWREASWLYSTGRREQAIAKLQSIPDRRLAERQLAVWNTALPSDLEALKNRYERTPPAADGQIRAFYAAALAKAGKKAEARKLVERWPLPLEQGDPLAESLVFPIFLELRKQ